MGARNSFGRTAGWVLPALVLSAGLILTAILFADVRKAERHMIEDEFRQQAQTLAATLQADIDRNVAVVGAMAAFHAHGEEVSRQEFEDFAGRLLPSSGDIQALEWIPRVAASGRRAHEAAVRGEGFAGFLITERRAAGEITAAAARPEYFPVYFAVPSRGNERALGFDLASDAVRRAALEGARDSGETTATARIALIQEAGSQYGFLICQPLYGKGGVPETIEARRAGLRGFVAGVFRIGDLVEYALRNVASRPANLALYDLAAPAAERLLYRRDEGGGAAPRAGLFRLDRPLAVPGRQWQLHLESTSDFETAHRGMRAWAVLAAGLLFSFFAAAHLRQLSVRGRAQQTEAEYLQAVARQLEEEVAERRQAEAALRESERKFQTITAAARDAIIIIDERGAIAYWNTAAETIFGYGADEVFGRNLHDLLAPARFHADHHRAFERFRASGEGAAIGKTLELPALRKGGEEFTIELSLAAVQVGGAWNAVGIVRDVTARLRAEAERRQLSEALRQSQEAILLVDADLRCSYANPAFSRLFGYGVDEVVGRSLDMLVPEQARWNVAKIAALVIKHGAFSDQVSPQGKDGRQIPVLLSVAPMRDEAGVIANFVVTMIDLRELKRAEAEAEARLAESVLVNEELRRANERLTQAQTQLLQSEKMASIGLLAAGVAHEINNPVGYVKSNLGTLQEYIGSFLLLLDAYARLETRLATDDSLLAEVHTLKAHFDLAYLRHDVVALLEESHEGIGRVQKIVADLKGFAHADVIEEWKFADLHQGIESTLNVVWNELKYKCEVRKEYGNLPPVECVLSQIEQVFMNLLVNAAHAIEERGVITIRTGVEGEEAWIEIADTGKGIPAENLAKIFDPFFTTKPVGKGTGLGLSVSYNIVQKHHGRIEVKSRVGEGTTFRIWLPVRQPAPAA